MRSTIDQSSIELPTRHNPHHEEEGRDTAALPPVDGGRDAWLALAGAFVLEAMVWGFPYSYGIFQTYYSTHEPFSREPAGIAAISTTATAIMFLASPFVALWCQRWPQHRRTASLGGWVVTVVSLIAASYCQSTAGLLATQGVLFALGGMWLYFPCMYIVDEWFVARKGLAFGIVWTGTSVAGAVVPWVSQWLLDTYGFRTALRVWAIIIAVLSLPSILVMKNRLPSTGLRRLRPVDWSFVKQAPFWFYECGVVMQSLAYFLPSLWIPSFSRAMGMPTFSGPLALCLLNIAACGGYLLQGRLVDKYHVTTTIFAATLTSVIAIFVFWGFTTSQPMLYVFAILWGVSGAALSSTWAGCANAMRQSCNGLDTALVISLLCAGKGIGSVMTGPISEQLLRVAPWHGAKFAYGSECGAVIVFTGVTAVLGGSACVGRAFKVM